MGAIFISGIVLGLKCELVRMATSDGLELQGLLFEPAKPGRRAVIHLHGWTGNFYENAFIDHLAKHITAAGAAFLTMNTRGAGHVQEFIRTGRRECIKIGGSLERFEDSVKDVGAAVSFLTGRGYRCLFLGGHSTACQKAVHYYLKRGGIEGLILLEPTDDPAVSAKLLGKRYEEAMTYAKRLVEDGRPLDPMPSWMPFGVQLSAQKFLSMSDPKSVEGRLFNYSGELEELRKIKCPALVVYGAKTSFQNKPEEKLKMLKKAIPTCETKLIDSDHWFSGHEKELGLAVAKWLMKT